MAETTSTSVTTDLTAASGGGASAAPAHGQRVIWLLLCATFVVILNETIMSVAIRKLSEDLHVSNLAAQWLSTAFMLTMAVVIPITGFLLQRFSTRQMFIAAMTFFSAGTLLAALAPGFEVLLMARVVQACGTAIMMPLLMTTLMQLVEPSKRGRTMGNVSIVISVAPAIGPTIAGLILNSLSWRWLFIIVLPIALIMLLIGARWVRNVSERKDGRIDALSVVLSAFGFGGLVYGLSEIGASSGPNATASPITMWTSIVVGVIALALFIYRQTRLQRFDRALLDLRTFGSRIFSASLIIMAIAMAAMFGTIIVLPIYLQQVLHVNVLSTGLLLLPGGLAMGLLAPLVGRLYDRVDPRFLVVPGMVVVSGVLWGLTLVTDHTPVPLLLVAHISLSIGLAFLFTPLFSAGLGAVPPRFYSHGSALIGTLQQVAGAAGTALFVTIMTAQTVSLAATGVGADASAAGGVRMAFLAGAIISLFGVAASFFIRKPLVIGGADAHGGAVSEGSGAPLVSEAAATSGAIEGVSVPD